LASHIPPITIKWLSVGIKDATHGAAPLAPLLAKDVNALFKMPLWHKAMAEEGLSGSDAPALLGEMFGALREVVLYIASEIDDPPRRDDS
jgi:hypothetical protein